MSSRDDWIGLCGRSKLLGGGSQSPLAHWSL